MFHFLKNLWNRFKMGDHKTKFEFIDEGYPCPDCGNKEWIHMMDSLADACTKCLYVRVGSNGKYTRGVPLDQWAKDISEVSEETE